MQRGGVTLGQSVLQYVISSLVPILLYPCPFFWHVAAIFLKCDGFLPFVVRAPRVRFTTALCMCLTSFLKKKSPYVRGVGRLPYSTPRHELDNSACHPCCLVNLTLIKGTCHELFVIMTIFACTVLFLICPGKHIKKFGQ